jgi:hypothetical protein
MPTTNNTHYDDESTTVNFTLPPADAPPFEEVETITYPIHTENVYLSHTDTYIIHPVQSIEEGVKPYEPPQSITIENNEASVAEHQAKRKDNLVLILFIAGFFHWCF